MKRSQSLMQLFGLLTALALVLAACGSPTPVVTEAPSEPSSATEAPTTDEGTEMDMCYGAQPGDEVTLLYQWSGAEEESFNAAIAPIVEACGLTIVPESSRDQALLETRIESGDAWDLVFWPTVGPIGSYGDKLIALDTLGADAANYAPAWMASGNGNWLGVAVKADPKSIVWYSPVNFDANGYSVPTTWADFVALADQMVADGNVPFAMGFESGDATGWTASDFIQDILLSTQGSAYVNGILDGSVAYNDAGVADAYGVYAGWATDPAYAVGGAEGSLSTSFSDAILQPFSDPPQAMMVKQSGFAGGAIAAQYPELEFGTDFSFFHFPGADGVQGGADWMMAFADTPAVRAIVAYLTSAEGGAHWAATGFGLSPNSGSAGNYADPINAALAEVLAGASAATPDIGDSIQPSFGSAEWRAIVDVVSGASSIDAALAGAADAQAADQGN
ncbi:MAG: carbohydrate ABC transporter substrate-binding protein [Anaerolineales bacterium]|nr:carbohydrate ABC transporter substrate-binding protein [Anaerolineales bacterium]MCW5839070.1 carbohydrate ABC transporter substrate-binding protein [Anaerolineales bacterium]